MEKRANLTFELAKIKERNENLTYYDPDHAYMLNGEELPFSISELAGYDVDVDYEEGMAEYGTDVHNQLERYNRYGELETTVQCAGDMFLRSEFEFDYMIPEEMIYSDSYSKPFAGRFDLMLVKKGRTDKTNKRILIDYKTSNKIYMTHKRQVNLYSQVLEHEYGLKVHQLVLVRVERFYEFIAAHKIRKYKFNPDEAIEFLGGSGMDSSDIKEVENESIREEDGELL